MTPIQRFASGARRLVPAGLLSVSLTLAPSQPLAAQEPLPGVFSDVIDVRVVNVEAVVTDRRGNRVSGLAAADFRLLVDGDEVPIDYFSEVLGGQAVEAGGVPADAPQGLPSLVPGEPVGTSYLVFVDDFFPVQRDRNRVLEALAQQVPLLNPEDRMALVAFDGRKLTMLSSWSQSQAALERAIKEAIRRPAGGLERLAEQRKFLAGRAFATFERLVLTGGDPFQRLTPEERFYAELLIDQVKRLVSGASATLRSFAQPPGRKVMILLSGGWPFDPVQVSALDQRFAVLDSELDRGDELFRPLSDTANLLGYTLYPVDVPGLEGTGPDAGVAEAPDLGSVSALSPEQEAHYSLTYLAAKTGGRALLNARRINALGEAASDTRSYYWLGFTPRRSRDGKGHRIEVEVRRPDLKIRSRRGFLDFSRQAEVSAMVESTLLFGSAPSRGALPVEVGKPKPAGVGRMEAPLHLAIPVDAITVLPVGGRFVSELELRIAVLDEEGNQAEIPVIPLRLDGQAEPEPGGVIRYDTSVKLRKRRHEVVVALYDPASGRILSNRVEVKP
jgi:VWFA-related protein